MSRGSGQSRSNNSGGRSNTGSSKKRGGQKKKSGRKSKSFDPVKFWGDPGAEQPLPELPISVPDPSATVASLGHPPLPGQGAASQQYFRAVTERASMLAGALALAGGLDEHPADSAGTEQPSVAGNDNDEAEEVDESP